MCSNQGCIRENKEHRNMTAKNIMAGIISDDRRPSPAPNVIFTNEFKGQTNVNDAKLVVMTVFVGSF